MFVYYTVSECSFKWCFEEKKLLCWILFWQTPVFEILGAVENNFKGYEQLNLLPVLNIETSNPIKVTAGKFILKLCCAPNYTPIMFTKSADSLSACSGCVQLLWQILQKYSYLPFGFIYIFFNTRHWTSLVCSNLRMNSSDSSVAVGLLIM